MGLMFGHPQVGARLLATHALDYYTKVVLALAAAYISGWVLFLLVAYGFNYLLVRLYLKSRPPVNQDSKRREWRIAAEKFVGQDLKPTNDDEWADLYLVLQNYFLKTRGGDTYQVLTTLSATGWTGLLVLWFSPVTHWLAYMICALAIFVGLLWPWWVAPLPAGPHLTALILRELKKKHGGPTNATTT